MEFYTITGSTKKGPAVKTKEASRVKNAKPGYTKLIRSCNDPGIVDAILRWGIVEDEVVWFLKDGCTISVSFFFVLA